jgi:hypothetical protein
MVMVLLVLVMVLLVRVVMVMVVRFYRDKEHGFIKISTKQVNRPGVKITSMI